MESQFWLFRLCIIFVNTNYTVVSNIMYRYLYVIWQNTLNNCAITCFGQIPDIRILKILYTSSQCRFCQLHLYFLSYFILHLIPLTWYLLLSRHCLHTSVSFWVINLSAKPALPSVSCHAGLHSSGGALNGKETLDPSWKIPCAL